MEIGICLSRMKGQRRNLAIGALLLACFLLPPHSLALELSDIPLEIQIKTPPPQVMLIWDDSGSMDWEFMTPQTQGLFHGCGYLFGDDAYLPKADHSDGLRPRLNELQRRMWLSQWAGYNRLYYDPRRTYRPWPSTANYPMDAADLNSPWSDPARTSAQGVHLAMWQEFYSVRSGAKVITIPNAHYFTIRDVNGNGRRDPGEAVYLVTWQDADGDHKLDVSNRPEADQRRFFRFEDRNANGIVEDEELIAVVAESEKKPLRAVKRDAQGAVERNPTDREELQNFVNWFSYGRRREFAAKAAVAQAIAEARDLYMGFYALNQAPRVGLQPVHVSAIDRPDGSQALLDALYAAGSFGPTPLRNALDQVGRYFEGRATGLSGLPASAAGLGGCQNSYAIVLSDGFWDDDFSGAGNADGDQGPPFADMWSNTLADVAMQYFNTDLSLEAPDWVIGKGCDQNARQHMVTHAVAFGAPGTLDSDDIDRNGRKDAPGDRSDPCWGEPTTPRPVWPKPEAGQSTSGDDVWHAAVNGRGSYFSADTPEDLRQALQLILAGIVEPAYKKGITAVGSDRDENGVLHQARYQTDHWSGDLLAFASDPQTGEADTSGRPLWRASDHLKPGSMNYDERRVVTYGGPWRPPQGIPFRYAELSDRQKTALGSDLVSGSVRDRNAASVLEYIRGRELDEFRQRASLLGDIVHSGPVQFGGMLFVGANDGMLHAFDAATGEEAVAYVPNLVFSRLKLLSDPVNTGRHLSFVDATPSIGEILEGPYQRTTYLVGGLGQGGKGYYCLRIGQRRRTHAGARGKRLRNHFQRGRFTNRCRKRSQPDCGLGVSPTGFG